MNDWVGLGWDGAPVVRGLHNEDRPGNKYEGDWAYSNQMPVKEVDRERKRDKNGRKSEMDILWERMMMDDQER